LLLLTIAGWLFGVAEKRNDRIEGLFVEDVVDDKVLSAENNVSVDTILPTDDESQLVGL